MTVKKTQNGTYRARFMFDGKNYSQHFPTSRAAKIWEAATRKALTEGAAGIAAPDKRRLSELCQSWYDLHGYTLKDGRARLVKLISACEDMNNPRARDFSALMFAEYKRKRLSGEIVKKDALTGRQREPVGMNTINKLHRYIQAVFSELIRLKNWNGANPLAGVRLGAIGETGVRYLSKEEITALLAECKKSKSSDLELLVTLILSTGARWGEAQYLRHENVQNQLVTLHGIDTKSGKTRHIPISAELFNRLKTETPPHGRLFPVSRTTALDGALTRAGIELPDNQRSHVLRHSFAAHFIAHPNGDILTLSKLLGHSTIQQTMTYAHLAPDYLKKAVDLNPIARFS